MSRISGFSSPFMLGFDDLERVFDRATKSANEGYPPYNIERLSKLDGDEAEVLRITLAVAGFTMDELDVSVEENQLTISGAQQDDEERMFLHRGIATRQFQRAFVLAEGLEVSNANMQNGLLQIDIVRLQPERIIRKIEINSD